MITITRENAEIKSFITGFLSDAAHDNQSSDSLLANVFRIALASLEAEPVAYIFKHPAGKLFWALTDESNKEQSDVIPVYAAPPVPVVPEEKPMPNHLKMYAVDAVAAIEEVRGWNACREAMLQSQGEGNPHATPTHLPGGFTIEDAKALHEDLVRSHISQALSGEKMKKKDRDADLRWIHDVIVQAAWFVKASLEKNALSGNSPVTPDGWISCSDRMPSEEDVLVYCSDTKEQMVGFHKGKGLFQFFYMNGVEGVCEPSHWMPLPEPPL